MKLLSGLALATLILIVGASAANALEISEGVYANYQKYLKAIGSHRKGAFAVADDGYGSFFTYCSDPSCASTTPTTLSQDAIKGCAALTGQDCLILAYGQEQRIDYTVIASRTTLSEDDAILANVLPADRLKSFIVGNTMQGEYPNHKKWMEYYAPDGTLRGKADTLGTFRGRYEFKDNVICYHYQGHSDWDWCSQVSAFADRIYLLEDGELVTNESNTEMLPGNPHNL